MSSFTPWWLAVIGVLATLALAGCQSTPKPGRELRPELQDALTQPANGKPSTLPASVAQALVPTAQLALPALSSQPPEPRFDLNVMNLPVSQVFAALAKDTRYSLLVDPSLNGAVTVNLKDVTLFEALETLRDMFGFEYRVQGTRIFVQPATLQTRVFQVNYLTLNRAGRTDVRVTSGSIAASANNSTGGSTGTAQPGSTPAGGNAGTTSDSSRVVTQMRSDIWSEIETALKLLIGDKEGRQIIVSPQSGVILARAMPAELRAVEQYLKAARLNIERQVMLESKIVEVRLKDSSQTGVNWAAFVSRTNANGAVGLLNPGTALANSGALTSNALTATPGSALALGGSSTTGLFGLAFQTSNFAALLSFLETQGDLQVLSSPRIAALNNQKAVLKVGTDEFFVTSVTTTTTTGSGGSTSSPTINVQPFFSGVALDVTPQIDEDSNIILHIHPSVSRVQERVKQLNLGDLGSFTLPLAASTVSESDTVVRVRDGNIVAIGGLMNTSQAYDREQVPGLGGVPVLGTLFGSTRKEVIKSELVILIKPTVIHSDAQLDALRDESLQRIRSMTGASSRM